MTESAQLLRQWKLLQRLSEEREGVLLSQLATDLAASDRTIRRDLAVLQSAGFPLSETRGERGVKRWRMCPLAAAASIVSCFGSPTELGSIHKGARSQISRTEVRPAPSTNVSFVADLTVFCRLFLHARGCFAELGFGRLPRPD